MPTFLKKLFLIMLFALLVNTGCITGQEPIKSEGNNQGGVVVVPPPSHENPPPVESDFALDTKGKSEIPWKQISPEARLIPNWQSGGYKGPEGAIGLNGITDTIDITIYFTLYSTGFLLNTSSFSGKRGLFYGFPACYGLCEAVIGGKTGHIVIYNSADYKRFVVGESAPLVKEPMDGLHSSRLVYNMEELGNVGISDIKNGNYYFVYLFLDNTNMYFMLPPITVYSGGSN